MTTHTVKRQAAVSIVRTLRDAGHIAYFAGGCVRDELLGRAPADYDIATDAVPDRIAALFPRSNHVGAAFGVMLVSAARIVVEVATFRADGTYTDKRRPDRVTFSDPVADAHRRDFTVNALFLDPLAPAGDAGVIDHVGGVADLRAGVLRAVGDPAKRLEEDHLRALRAARLAAKLAFRIDPATADAVRRDAASLAGVSRERIGDELRKMFTHPARAQAAELLHDLGLDEPIAGRPGAPTPGSARFLQALAPAAGFAHALAAWALDRGIHDDPNAVARWVSDWRARLCLSNDERDALARILLTRLDLRARWASLSIAARKRAASRPEFGEALDLVGAENPELGSEIRAAVEVLARTPSGLAPEPLLTGDGLITAGFRPGPAFKAILDRVYDAQLEDRVRSASEALALARALEG